MSEDNYAPVVTRSRAATVADVLVAAAALVLPGAVGILALRPVRDAAEVNLCMQNLGRLGTAMQIYGNDNFDYFPGVNTTGPALEAHKLQWNADPNVLHDPNLPVQTWDWLAPLALVNGDVLPANRAARWHDLMTRYACPAQDRSALIYSGGSVPDLADFQAYAWPATSYLMPASFQFWGPDLAGTVVGHYEGTPIPIYARTMSPAWEVDTGAFRARRDLVGPAERKIFLADGTRYVDAGGLISLDVSPSPSLFGAWSSPGGWWPGDVAWGVAPGTLNWDGDPVASGSPSAGLNLPLSYRHDPFSAVVPQVAVAPEAPPRDSPRRGRSGAARDNHGTLNAVFFDGHAERMTDRASRAIDRWYPAGSIVNDPIGMTTEAAGDVVP